MLKTKFKFLDELNAYLDEQKIRKEKGYLTLSERKQLDDMLQNSKKYIEPEKIATVYKKIITDRNQLEIPCQEVIKDDNIQDIVKELKNTLNNVGGLGITANQIGINKRISYMKIPKLNKDKKIEFIELILINAKITEATRPIEVRNEACLSFPSIWLDTERYVFVTVEYLNEKLEQQTAMFQDLESFVVQHEIDHQHGIVIFSRKWRAK